MTRPLRVEYSGALYHVIARGNAKQKIFLDEKDRGAFLDWLEDMTRTHNVLCYAYCLMDNHYHLLIETIDANLSRAMRDLNGNYSRWFNVRHKKVGHLFQGRYKAFVVEKEGYLLEIARYIVLNPVRSHKVKYPGQWKWSSYNATVGKRKIPKFLTVDFLLSIFSKKKEQSRQQYVQFVKEGINAKDPHKNARNGFLIGDQQFVDWIWDKTNGSEEIREYARNERIVGRFSLKEIFRNIKTKQQRDNAIIFARMRCGYLSTEIARYIGLKPSVVGRISRGTYNVKRKKVRSRT